MVDVNNIVARSAEETVQSEPTVTVEHGSGSIGSILMLMASSADIVSPWWSRKRDMDIAKFWRRSDHLSGAMFTVIAKMTTIPFRIVPRDRSIKAHNELAEVYTDILYNGSQFGDGWISFYSKFIEDYYASDNGAFAEVIGNGDPSGPIEGPALSIAALDSHYCTRTGNYEYPVVYEDSGGKKYKLHRSRVIYASQMPSARRNMHGVGMCAISRALSASQNLYDIAIYKQEKLGSRPQRQLMITRGGIDPIDVDNAIRVAESTMQSQGLSRFSKTIAIGGRAYPDGDIKSIDLSSLPDGFDEQESTVLGMAVIANAFGMDLRELFPVSATGGTKADAIIQHLKQRGKGPGHTLAVTEQLLNQKFLPPFLQAIADYQDDAEDRQRAEIVSVRSQSRERDVALGVLDIRTSREQMFLDGEITDEQFEALELSDGRLSDGTDIEALFYSSDKVLVSMLSDVNEQNQEERQHELMGIIETSKDVSKIKKARQALAAIKHRYDEQEEENQSRTKPVGTDDSYSQDRFGRTLPRHTEYPITEEEENYSE